MTEVKSERSREIEAELHERSETAHLIRFVEDHQTSLALLKGNKMPLRTAKVTFNTNGTFDFYGATTAYIIPIFAILPYGDPDDLVHPYGSDMIDIGAIGAFADKVATRYGIADFLGQHNFNYPPLQGKIDIVKSPQRWIQRGGFGICPITDRAVKLLSNDDRGLQLVANINETPCLEAILKENRPKLTEIVVGIPQ